MLTEGVLAWRNVRSRPFGRLRRRALQVFTENLFRGARLSRDFGEADEGGFREPAATNAINGDALLFGAALKDYGVQILNSPRQFRRTAQRIVQLFYFLV